MFQATTVLIFQVYELQYREVVTHCSCRTFTRVGHISTFVVYTQVQARSRGPGIVGIERNLEEKSRATDKTISQVRKIESLGTRLTHNKMSKNVITANIIFTLVTRICFPSKSRISN